jgi:glycosyltransferase involved in cell wall biosynthesis
MTSKKKVPRKSPDNRLSVIVCTLGRYEELQHCLRALDPSVQSTEVAFEILVIDQNPLGRRELLKIPYVKQIFQDELGLSVGRNLGIAEAAYDLIAFLDDDAVPCVEWVHQVTSTFALDTRQQYLALGGRVDPDWRHGKRPSWMNLDLEKYLSCINWSESARVITAAEYIVGANMTFRRKVFDEFGFFDPSLGRKGDAGLLSNEEISLISKIGHERIIYNPHAQAYHIIQPPRFHQQWFRKRVYWQAISDLIGNSVWMSTKNAENVIAEFVLSCPAELRNLRAFYTDFHDEVMMGRQMKAIYAYTVLGAQGFPSSLE